MKQRFTDISWPQSIKIALGLTALGMFAGSILGLIIGLTAPGFYDLIFGTRVINAPIIGFFLGMGNGSLAGVALGVAFLIAVGIAQRGSAPQTDIQFSNYPRE